MDGLARTERLWTADEFIQTDQGEFGDAWRYELIDGRIVGHAAPSPDHGAISSALAAALVNRLRGIPTGCRVESGSGAVPIRKQRNTARIPDVMIRCRDLPRVVFEIVSPSEVHKWRARDRKRQDLQETEGVQEIVEIYQTEIALHIYRRQPDASWSFESVGGADATLTLCSVGFDVPLAEIYEFAMPAEQPAA